MSNWNEIQEKISELTNIHATTPKHEAELEKDLQDLVKLSLVEKLSKLPVQKTYSWEESERLIYQVEKLQQEAREIMKNIKKARK